MTILVGTWTDGLFAVEGQQRRRELAEAPVRGLARDGRGGALAIAGQHTLVRRGPGGQWSTLAESDLVLSCCVVVCDMIYVGTDDARMLRLGESGEFEILSSFDTVPGRESWFAGSAIVNGTRMGPPLGIRSLATNADGSIVFANVHVGGIPRSTDGGRSWTPTLEVNSDVHEVQAHPSDPSLVAAACAVGLCVSRDGGATWSIERDGLHAPHCSAVVFAGDDILVSAARDPFAPEGRVYRRPVGAAGPLAAVEGGMPAWTEGIVDTGCIAVSDADVVIADRGGNLYVSHDHGRDWQLQYAGLPAPSGVLIVRSA